MPLPLEEGTLLQMKKPHPCGGDLFRVLRVGSDLRVVCCRCGRDLTLPRRKWEPHVKKILEGAMESPKAGGPEAGT